MSLPSPVPTQIIELPIPSGSLSADKLQKTNEEITNMQAQALQDSKYDPRPLPYSSSPSKQPFTTNAIQCDANGLIVIGILLIVYGIFSK